MDLTGAAPTGRERLKVVDAEYTVESSGNRVPEPVVHLFCRDSDRNKRVIDVEGFRPYFMLPYETFIERTSDVINDRHVVAVEANLGDFEERKSLGDDVDFDGDPETAARWLTDTGSCQVYHESDTFTDLDGPKLVKVFTIEPSHVGKIREYFDGTYEADIPFERRFLISSGIKLGCEIPDGADTVRYENWRGHSDTDGCVKEIEPSSAPDVAPRMLVTDIEVATHGGGVPDPDKAPNEITAITAYDNYTEEYAGWILESDQWETEYEFEDAVLDRLDIELDSMQVYDHEGAMLEDFNNWVIDRNFDLVTGWNSNWFDYPYIINRSYSQSAYKIREWDKFGNPGAWRTDDDNIRMNIGGLVTFDMLNAYKKTQYRELRSYSLEDVAQAELGMGKEDIESDLDDAWHQDPVDFMVYNVRDVQAVVEIEKSSSLLDLYDNMRRVTGALYTTCNHNGPMLDTLFLRQAYEEGVALTTNYEPDQGDYHGAWVADPVPGKHDTVVYPDLASLYPYILWTLNISPETMFESKEAYRDAGYTDEQVFTAYIDGREWDVMSSGETVEPGKIDKDIYKGVHDETGSRKKKTSKGFDGIFDPLDADHPKSKTPIYFVKPDVKEGFIRKTVDLLVDLKYEYKGQKDMYAAVKRVTNSVYGVLGDSASGGVGFRLFDWKLAESITLGGQMVINYTADKYIELINQYSTDAGYEPGSYLVGGDTDSVMTAIPQAPDYKTALEWSQRASEQVSGELYDQFMEDEFNVIQGRDEHKMDVEIESLGSSLFFMDDDSGSHYSMGSDGYLVKQNEEDGVKKRYAQHLIWDEDDGWLDTEDPPSEPGGEGYENAPEDPDDRSEIKYLSDVSIDDYEDGGPLSVWGDPEDHIGITGFEYVRSDSAIITVEAQERVLTDILLADNVGDRLHSYLSDLRDDVLSDSVPAEKLGRPKGISKALDDYGWKSTEELRNDTNYTVNSTDEENGGRYVSTPGPTYRGRKYAVDHFTWEDGDQKKCIRLYIDQVRGDEYPAAYEYDEFPRVDRPDSPEVGRSVDAITVEYVDRVPDDFVIDREKMMEKELKDKIEPIIETVGHTWDDVVGQGRQTGLDAFA